jgi:nucleoside diphosphate kinase
MSEDGVERQQFDEIVRAIEDAGFEVLHERFKNDRDDAEFKVEFWIRSTGTDTACDGGDADGE